MYHDIIIYIYIYIDATNRSQQFSHLTINQLTLWYPSGYVKIAKENVPFIDESPNKMVMLDVP